MTFDEFHAGVLNTLRATDDHNADVMHMAFGLAEEAGEVSGKFKRLLRGDPGADLDDPEWRAVVLKECGDVLWYVDALVCLLGSDLDSVADGILRKLADRKARGVLTGSGDSR